MRLFIFLGIFTLSLTIMAQGSKNMKNDSAPGALTVGLFQGGGSLVGMDIDLLLGKRIGVQGGGGYKGLGAGLLYHIGEPNKINTSAISFSFWQYGFGSNYIAAYTGPSIIVRLFDILSVQGGIGANIDKGPRSFNQSKVPTYILKIGLGVFFFKN